MEETNQIIKYKVFFNYEKEEQWINEMARQGWNLVDYSVGKYIFAAGEPGEYLYRYEYLPENTPLELEKKAAGLSEKGIETIKISSGWLVMRKKAAAGPFEPFNNREEKIRNYQSLIRLINSLALALLVIGLAAVTNPAPRSRVVSTAFFLAAAVLFILIGLYSSRVKQLLKEKEAEK